MALPRSALWLMGLMSVPPVGKERVLLAVERGGDSFTQLSRFRHEVIKPSQDATEGGVRRILSRHTTNYCNWYSINYGLVASPPPPLDESRGASFGAASRLRSMNLGGRASARQAAFAR